MKYLMAYNKYEDVKKCQRGGVATASFGNLSQFVKETGADKTRLGQWS